jgi:uncharacterized membrane protein
MEPSQSDWIMFRDRVAEAANIARAATTNVVTALTSITIATADVHHTPLSKAMLFAMGGAALSALVVVIALTIEAVRANRYATRWHRQYCEFHDKALAHKPLPSLPWDELRFARLSVGVRWKVLLPVMLFMLGLFAAAVMFITER